MKTWNASHETHKLPVIIATERPGEMEHFLDKYASNKRPTDIWKRSTTTHEYSNMCTGNMPLYLLGLPMLLNKKKNEIKKTRYNYTQLRWRSGFLIDGICYAILYTYNRKTKLRSDFVESWSSTLWWICSLFYIINFLADGSASCLATLDSFRLTMIATFVWVILLNSAQHITFNMKFLILITSCSRTLYVIQRTYYT